MSAFIISFIVSLAMIILLRSVAFRIGLLDSPGGYKSHAGKVPLVGGIAMFMGFFAATFLLNLAGEFPGDTNFFVFFFAIAILLAVGVYDDYLKTKIRTRFLFQAIAAISMALWGGVALYDLGGMFFNGNAVLGNWSILITLLAVVGGINAMNMSDGADGLAGSLAMVVISALIFLAWNAGWTTAIADLLALAGAVIAFLIFNLRTPWRRRARIFMGDAGSMFLGFILIWYMMLFSQGEHRAMTPVTALWIFAVPLFDMFCTMIRRIIMGQSPVYSDREHLHHLLQESGMSAGMSVAVIVLMSVMMAIIGIMGYMLATPEYMLFYGYIGFFIIYVFMIEISARHMRYGKVFTSVRIIKIRDQEKIKNQTTPATAEKW